MDSRVVCLVALLICAGASACVRDAWQYTPPDAAAVVATDAPVDAPSGPTPPRPLAPLSTATVTSRRPTLRWALTSGDGAHVDLCRDRALTVDCVAFDAVGARGAPPADLAAGLWFWRLAARAGATTTAAVGPVWQFSVGARTALDASWGTTPDVNGDGFSDVVVGATMANRAYVYLGSAGGVGVVPITLINPAGSAAFGASVASAGDLDGDGYGDLIVGANASNTAHVYFGGAGPALLTAAPVALTGPAGATSFGGSVTSAGDVNGDGRADLAVGTFASGRVYLYLGLGSRIAPAAVAILNPSRTTDNFGNRVANVGDVNGDGYSDLGVGAYQANSGYVYLGGAGGLGATPITIPGPPGSGACCGVTAGAGDLDGDGFDEVMIVAPAFDRVFIYRGGAASPLTGALPEIVGPGGYFGTDVAGAGDVNRDGHADVVVGAFRYGTPATGGAFVYLGTADGLGDTPAVLTGPVMSEFGGSVAGARWRPRPPTAAMRSPPAAITPPGRATPPPSAAPRAPRSAPAPRSGAPC
jgi:hypothetical protein